MGMCGVLSSVCNYSAPPPCVDEVSLALFPLVHYSRALRVYRYRQREQLDSPLQSCFPGWADSPSQRVAVICWQAPPSPCGTVVY
ncbi:hypothetical protein BDQ94DRAFT_147166 [Aspergillus welwitschiae]|uniref:Uncharacterized protein n=1 Tax=Aspergillus welwitschiae TaxID=1341132 RepID=A0A3F3PY97_9EURO|nr:hypothetical protein BDQ94DRAFT_147166 [Aspergillus welwitschiae]RDH31316.1 hypothetical protein BDQ94DRAFT_147166 [Aspergillus welwitschiae]